MTAFANRVWYPFRICAACALAALLMAGCATGEINSDESVLTQRNDNGRRGAYLAETTLTPSSVKLSTFGLLYSLPVNGPVVAQPLFTTEIDPHGKQRDVLYVATRTSFIHAFDVGPRPSTSGSRQLWQLELPVVPTAPAKQPVEAVWRDNDHLDLFLAGSDGRVLSNFWERNNGWWHEWYAIRPDTATAEAGVAQPITAVWGDPNNPHHLNLFMVDKNGAIRSIFCTVQANRPCWQQETWFTIGAVHLATPGQRVTAKWRDPSFSHLDLFVAGQDGRVLSNFWESSSGWHDWFPIRPDAATAAVRVPQEVTAVWGDPNNPQHLNLFMVDKEGTVKSIFCTLQPNTPCWKRESWFPIGAAGLATPGQKVTAVWRDEGSFTHLDLFIVGRDGRVLSNFWDRDSGWHDWFAIRPDAATAAAGVPQEVTALWGDPNNPQHLNLFIVDQHGSAVSIFCTLLPGRPCWREERWFAINSDSVKLVPGQNIAAVWRDAFSHLDLFATGAQLSGKVFQLDQRAASVPDGVDLVSRLGAVVSNYWETASGWGTWFPVPLRAEALPGMDDGPNPCLQTHGQVGIVGTPAIDGSTGTMYVVYRTGTPPDLEPGHNGSDGANNYRIDSHHWLAAVDIRTGRLRQAPVEIAAPQFDPNVQLNRPGLLLQGDSIVIAFAAAVCDFGGNPYQPADQHHPHGWIYSYRKGDLLQQAVFTTASNPVAPGPAVADNAVLAGIWQSGTSLASDSGGNIYAFTGNNTALLKTPTFSESILRLRIVGTNFSVRNYQVPEATDLDGENDGDLGAGAPVLAYDNCPA